MNNTVTFKVAGNEVFAFQDQLKRKSDQVTNDMLSNARKLSVSAKEQLKFVEDHIKALERRNKLESETARQSAVEQKKGTISSNWQQYQSEVSSINEKIQRGELGTFKGGKMISAARETMEDKNSTAEKTLKEQLSVIREQERTQVLQSKFMRENVEEIKQSSSKQLSEMKREHSEVIEEMSDEDKKNDPRWALANDYAKEKYKEEKEPSIGKQVVGGILNMRNLESLTGSMGQLAQTQNGFDMLAPGSKGAGTVIGSVLGGILGAVFSDGLGTMAGAGIGGQIGGMFGDTMGQFTQRRAIAAQDFLGSKNKYEATTGGEITSVSDMTKMGISAAEYLQTLRQIALNTADASKAAEATNDVLSMEKGIGVSREVSSQMLTYFRGTQKDISNLVAGVLARGSSSLFAGGDTTFLNEFLQKFNQLHNELRSTQENVATGTTYDILSTFNRMGGQFSARDPRSMGLISGINQSLVNPGSDATQALSFLALRKSNPGLGIAGLMEERQKGLASPTYLKSMLAYVDQLGGDKDMKIMNTAGMLGLQGNVSAARRLYENRGKVGRMSQDQLEELYSGDYRSKAEGKTTVIEQNMASIKNGLLSTWSDGVEAMVGSFTKAIESALDGAVINIGGQGTIKFGSALKTNVVKTKRSAIVAAADPTNSIGITTDIITNLLGK